LPEVSHVPFLQIDCDSRIRFAVVTKQQRKGKPLQHACFKKVSGGIPKYSFELRADLPYIHKGLDQKTSKLKESGHIHPFLNEIHAFCIYEAAGWCQHGKHSALQFMMTVQTTSKLSCIQRNTKN
jgi:hypothetical protein